MSRARCVTERTDESRLAAATTTVSCGFASNSRETHTLGDCETMTFSIIVVVATRYRDMRERERNRSTRGQPLMRRYKTPTFTRRRRRSSFLSTRGGDELINARVFYAFVQMCVYSMARFKSIFSSTTRDLSS